MSGDPFWTAAEVADVSVDPFWTAAEVADFVARVQANTERRRLTITIELQESTIFEVEPMERAGDLLATASHSDSWWENAEVLEAHWER